MNTSVGRIDLSVSWRVDVFCRAGVWKLEVVWMKWTFSEELCEDSLMFGPIDHSDTARPLSILTPVCTTTCMSVLLRLFYFGCLKEEVENLLEPLGGFKQKEQNIARQNKFSLSLAVKPLYSTLNHSLILNTVKSCSSVYHSSPCPRCNLCSNCCVRKSLSSDQFDLKAGLLHTGAAEDLQI